MISSPVLAKACMSWLATSVDPAPRATWRMSTPTCSAMAERTSSALIDG